jgi:hypothetical protein
MRDLKLEQELALLRSVMAEGKALRDIVQATLSTEVVVPEHERRLESLRQSLPAVSTRLRQEVGLAEDKSVEQLFDKVTDLPSLVRFTEMEKSKLYDLWHRWYLGLYAVQGRLKWRKEKLEALHPATLGLKRYLLNPFLLLILIGALALLVLALI